MLNEKDDDRQNVRNLFKDRRQHHHSVSDWIATDKQEHKLPRERDTGETVVKLRVIDGGWSLLADVLEDDVHGQDLHDAPYPGEEEHDFGEFQVALLMSHFVIIGGGIAGLTARGCFHLCE